MIIAEKNIVALLDTASDINAIRVEQYEKLGSPPLTGSNIRYKGVGLEIFTTLGSFRAEIKIDDDIFKLSIHVIPNACFEYNLPIGSDLLAEARILLDGKNAKISGREHYNRIESAIDVLDQPAQEKFVQANIDKATNVIPVCMAISVCESRALRPIKEQYENNNLLKSVGNKDNEQTKEEQFSNNRTETLIERNPCESEDRESEM
ncbi:hypothetical protein QLX08_004377 [Tetragonisca angustula]|uniref:Peptidase A2 domain-containing protein n=1 Tax=Tetragonisca angustula TaxID=166442 RepID=A0AAW1A308_9HYME